MSEFLRVEQGRGEITEKKDRNEKRDCGDDVDLHGLPQLLACLNVEKRHGEEDGCVKEHEQILHKNFQVLSVRGRGLAPGTRQPLSRFWSSGNWSAQKIF
jgi:hypothetical protein